MLQRLLAVDFLAFSELETARNASALRWFLERRRPPSHIRPELDLNFQVTGHVVDVFEVRPDWRDASKTMRTPVARVRFLRSQDEWRLYWMHADLKWHLYEPDPRHTSLRAALAVVDADAYFCFFG